MGDILGEAIVAIASKLVNLLKKPVRYLCFYSCNVNQLREEVSKLKIDKNSLNEKIENARVEWGGIRLPSDVQDWLSKVNDIETESNLICDEATHVQNTRLSKWIPFLHFSLSRKAQKATEAAVQTRNPRFEQVAYPLYTADLKPIPTTSEILLKSRLFIEEEIIDALKKNDAYLIGIHGMGGVGKTTMVENIERKLAEKKQNSSKMFEHVVKAVVSQEPDLLKIQKQVAEGLGLKLEDENLSNRAKRLHTSLVNTQSVLIIFDDVWDRLDLEHIGIPSQSTHVGCKLILTSRNRKALTSTAENAKIFPLNVLEDDEAWVLFRKNAGNSIDSPELHHIAKQVCRECKGLPLALEVVGRALNGESKECWENALVGLQQAMPQNIPEVLEHVYKPLLLSFDKLESEYRYLLLLCCLFEEDSLISIEELVGYGMGIGMFEDMEQLSEVRNKVKSIMLHLISRSLLLDSIDDWGNLNVKMHDVVRDVGIHMKKHEFLISHGRKEWPKIIKEGSYGNYTCISLTSSEKNASFPECKDCPRLQLLRVAHKGLEKLKLPNNLFTITSISRSLKVLEIRRLDSLPSSIHMLKNLRTLCLVRSRLERVLVIGELMNLEILFLRWCEFDMLPKNIGKLKNLKKLDVIDCRKLKKIEYGVMSGLVRLEELFIIGRSLEWGVEEDGQGINDKSCLAELNSLDHLTTLCIQISNWNAIPKKMPLWVHKVKKYSIILSRGAYVNLDLLRFRKGIHLGYGVALLGDWFYDQMARNAEYLELCGPSCTNVVTRLISSGYQNTRVLKLKLCNNVKYLSRAFFEGQHNCPIFQVLKILDIKDSDSLEEISNGALSIGSFKELEEIHLQNLSRLTHLWTFSRGNFYLSILKIIRIQYCESLLYVFPLSVVESLTQLEELEVSNCADIKEIFKREEKGVEITINKIKLPKLCILSLDNLPSLHDFAKGIEEVEVPELQKFVITNVPTNMRDDGQDAQHIYLFDLRVASNDQQPQLSLHVINNMNGFSVLETLRIEFIANVKNIFSPSILSGFVKLRELHVEGCSKLENVVGEIKTNTTLFPQMQRLTLIDLPELISFCHIMGKFELPLLKELQIRNCPMMGTFCKPFSNVSIKEIPKSEYINQPFFCEKVASNDLQPQLSLHAINNMNGFSVLETLTIFSLDNVKIIFSPSVLSVFAKLRELYVEGCSKLENVVGDIKTNTILFPQMQQLTLIDLPELLSFCHIMGKFELPLLEKLQIRNCPMMGTFCKLFSDVSVKEIPKSEYINQHFFCEEVLFPNISELDLKNIKAARIFGENIPIDSFCGLQKLEVQNCERITNVFSDPTIFTSLRKLDLLRCGELQEVIAEKYQNIKITLFPWLRELYLMTLPKMRTFCHIKDDIELSSLQIMTIHDCPKFERFSLGRLHLPVFKELRGLSDPDFATKIFFHKERSSSETHLDNNFFTTSATDLSFKVQPDPAKLILTLDSSNRNFCSAAELVFCDLLEINGKLETEKLVEGVVYEVILIIRYDDEFVRYQSFLSKLILHGEVRPHNNNERKISMYEIPRGKWFEILVGEFIREPHHIGELQFSISLSASKIITFLIYNYRFTLYIKGIVIRSKDSKE